MCVAILQTAGFGIAVIVTYTSTYNRERERFWSEMRMKISFYLLRLFFFTHKKKPPECSYSAASTYIFIIMARTISDGKKVACSQPTIRPTGALQFEV